MFQIRAICRTLGLVLGLTAAAAATAVAQDSTAGAVEDRVTGTYDDSTWQDTAQGRQNPPGYRGMERPAGDSTVAGDTATAGDTAAADTTKSGRFKSTKKTRSDTTSGDSAINDPQGEGRMERPAAADSAGASDTTDEL